MLQKENDVNNVNNSVYFSKENYNNLNLCTYQDLKRRISQIFQMERIYRNI